MGLQMTLIPQGQDISKKEEQRTEPARTKQAANKSDFVEENIIIPEMPKNEGYSCVILKMFTKGGLDGNNKYYIEATETQENPEGFDGSSWGCSTLSVSNVKEYFDDVLDNKKRELETPYKRFVSKESIKKEGYHDEADFYRLIPSRNYFVILSDKLKQIMLNNGFDFNEWYKIYKDLQEPQTREDYGAYIDKLFSLMSKGKAIENQADKIKKSLRYKLGETKGYDKEILLDTYQGEGLDSLFSKLVSLRKELISINNETKVLHKTLNAYPMRKDEVGVFDYEVAEMIQVV